MSTISMPNEIIRGRVTSCCFLGQTIGSARGLCGAAIDWGGFCGTIIERRRDAGSAGSVFWPYDLADYVGQLQADGVTSLRGIADALNANDIETPRGGAWGPSSVRNLLARIDA